MFTGIVRGVGVVKSISKSGEGCALTVHLGALDADSLGAGDSVAVNGVCLTVAELRHGHARFDISPETMARCLLGEWGEGDRVNLEPALTLQTPLGGHLVPGHVDGIGRVIECRRADAFTCMQFEAPRAIGRLIAAKGALTVDGVSLTTNEVSDHLEPGNTEKKTRFTVMLVPHTLETTTLGAIQPGARVHLEVDPVARYVQRLMEANSEE